MSTLFLNIFTLLAVTQSVDTLFHSFIVHREWIELKKHTEVKKNQFHATTHNSNYSLSCECTVIRVDSVSLVSELVQLFEKHKLPWNNLMSIPMDSCNVIRGSKSGVEKRIRDGGAPHLLDIDGDSCHHAHNGFVMVGHHICWT